MPRRLVLSPAFPMLGRPSTDWNFSFGKIGDRTSRGTFRYSLCSDPANFCPNRRERSISEPPLRLAGGRTKQIFVDLGEDRRDRMDFSIPGQFRPGRLFSRYRDRELRELAIRVTDALGKPV